MNEEPLISILVACYNQENFIIDCMKGMKNQTYQKIELIISDDASTDNSWNVIESYRETLEKCVHRLVLLHQEKNLGYIANLNAMLSNVTGDYVKIIAGDDFLDKEYVSYVVRSINKDENIGVWFTNGFVVSEQSTYDNVQIVNPFYSKKPEWEEEKLIRQLYTDNFVFAPSAVVKKALYDKYGTYDESLCIEDWEMWLRLATKGVKFGYIDECLVNYRKNSQSITSLSKSDKLEQKRIQLFLSSKEIVNRYRDFVLEKVWLDRITQIFIMEKKLAIQMKLGKLKRIVNEEIVHFVLSNRLGIKKKLKYLFRIWKEERVKS